MTIKSRDPRYVPLPEDPDPGDYVPPVDPPVPPVTPTLPLITRGGVTGRAIPVISTGRHGGGRVSANIPTGPRRGGGRYIPEAPSFPDFPPPTDPNVGPNEYGSAPSERTITAPTSILDQDIPFVYGSAKVGGMCAGWNVSGNYLRMAFVLCQGEQAGLGSIEINDEAIGTLGWVANYDTFLGNGTDAKPGTGYMNWMSTAAWDEFVKYCGVTVNVHLLTGDTPGGFRVTGVPTGRKFASFQSPYTVSNHTNPAEVAYDILTADIWKGLSSPADTGAGGTWEQFFDWWDESMGDATKRFSFNGVITTRDPDEALDEVLSTGFASKYFSTGGVVKLWGEIPPPAISGTWTASSSTVNGSGGSALSELSADDIVYVGDTPCIVQSVVTDNQFIVDRTVTETSVITRVTSGVYIKKDNWIQMPTGSETETGSIPDVVRVRYTLPSTWGSATYPEFLGVGDDKRIETTVLGCSNASMARRISEMEKAILEDQPFAWSGVADSIAAALEPGDIFFFDDDVLEFQPARVLPSVLQNRAGSVSMQFRMYSPSVISNSTQADPTVPTQPTGYLSQQPPHFTGINSVLGGTAYNFLSFSGTTAYTGDNLLVQVLDGVSIRTPNNVALLGEKYVSGTIQMLKVNSDDWLELGEGAIPIYLNASALVGKDTAMLQYDHSTPKNILTWSVSASLMQLGNSSAELNIFGDDITIGSGSIDVAISGATTTLNALNNIDISVEAVPLRGKCGVTYYDMIKTNTVTENKVVVGDTAIHLRLSGTKTRPDYNGNDLALYSDIIDPSGTYLPLSAGPSNELTGDLYLDDGCNVVFSNSDGVELMEVGDSAPGVLALYMGASDRINVGASTNALRLHGSESRPYYNPGGAGAVQLALLSDAGGGPGTDTTAIHDNVANEITAITAKSPTLHGADEIIIEDSNASYVKKAVTFTDLAGFVLDQEGGPFLPLSATSSYPLTGDLYIESAVNPGIYLREGGDTVNYGYILHDGTNVLYIRNYTDASNSCFLYFQANPGSASYNSYMKFNLGGDPALACYYQFYGPNKSTEVVRISGAAGTNNGYVTVYGTTTSALQAVYGSSGSNYAQMATVSQDTTYIRRYGSANAALHIFCTPVGGTGDSIVSVGYSTSTSGTNLFRLYDNTTIIHEFNLNTGSIDFCKAGGLITFNEDATFANDKYLQGKHTGGTAYDLIGVNSSNIVVVGNFDLPLYIKSGNIIQITSGIDWEIQLDGLVEFGDDIISDMRMRNDKFLMGENTSGTGYDLIGINSSNGIVVGSSALPVSFSGTTFTFSGTTFDFNASVYVAYNAGLKSTDSVMHSVNLIRSGAVSYCFVGDATYLTLWLESKDTIYAKDPFECDSTLTATGTAYFNSYIEQEYNKNYSIKDSGGTARGVMTVTGSTFRLGYDSLMTAIRGIDGGTSASFATGQWGIWKNSGDNSVWLVYNDGGTNKMVELTSTPHAEGT